MRVARNTHRRLREPFSSRENERPHKRGVDAPSSGGRLRRAWKVCFVTAQVLAALGKDKAVVPLSLFSRPHPPDWQPQHHMHYESRVIDIRDGLPKFVDRFGGARCDDNGDALEPT